MVVTQHPRRVDTGMKRGGRGRVMIQTHHSLGMTSHSNGRHGYRGDFLPCNFSPNRVRKWVKLSWPGASANMASMVF